VAIGLIGVAGDYIHGWRGERVGIDSEAGMMMMVGDGVVLRERDRVVEERFCGR
jgi:hypothetical protein